MSVLETRSPFLLEKLFGRVQRREHDHLVFLFICKPIPVHRNENTPVCIRPYAKACSLLTGKGSSTYVLPGLCADVVSFWEVSGCCFSFGEAGCRLYLRKVTGRPKITGSARRKGKGTGAWVDFTETKKKGAEFAKYPLSDHNVLHSAMLCLSTQE